MAHHSFFAPSAPDGALLRLDQAIPAAVSVISRRRARDLIAQGSVFIDGKRVRQLGRLVHLGAVVDVWDDPLPNPLHGHVADHAANHGDRILLPPILWEAGGGIVVDKPAGTACEPTRQSASSITDSFLTAGRPMHAVHRLDVDTSGALLLAQPGALAPWAAAFRSGQVIRSYVAIVAGSVEGDEGLIDLPLLPPDRTGRALVAREGKPSATAWRVLARSNEATLLAVTPRTGRTHQIRAHLAHVGHPLVGDHRYGVRHPGATHLGLHACRLALSPRTAADTGAVAFDVTAPFPAPLGATAHVLGLALPEQ
jgi:tRNA pseudouridine32 synthase/23S rRNA pseudouridine746 synthase